MNRGQGLLWRLNPSGYAPVRMSPLSSTVLIPNHDTRRLR
jgi:hypothetical protein